MLAKVGRINRQNGVGAGRVKWITPVLPKAANIVRAWSLRRCVPAYLGGNSIRADRPSAPVGSPGILGAFTKSGVIDFPAGADANAYELYDQKGEANAALVVAGGNLANAPLVYSSGAMLKGMSFDGNDRLYHANVDTSIDNAITSTNFTVSLWFRSNSTENSKYMLHFVSASAGHLIIWYQAGKIRTFVNSNGTYNETPTAYNDNVWHMVTIAHTSGSNGHKTYIDGSLVVQRNSLALTASTARPLSIGSSVAGLALYTGAMNDIIIWDRELSAPEVAALFEAQRVYYGVSAK